MSSAKMQDALISDECDIADVTDRERILRWMQAVTEATGWTPNRWAGIAKTSATNISRFIANDDASIPGYRTVSKLAAVAPPPYHLGPAYDLSDSPPAKVGGQIPIRTAGRAGADQEMYAAEILGYVPRPSSLKDVPGGYGVYVIGDSMSPRYEAGWLVFADPSRAPYRGRDVVVYRANGAVLLKRFIRRSDAEIVLEQLNPPEEIRIPVSDVKEIGLIVGIDMEGG